MIGGERGLVSYYEKEKKQEDVLRGHMRLAKRQRDAQRAAVPKMPATHLIFELRREEVAAPPVSQRNGHGTLRVRLPNDVVIEF